MIAKREWYPQMDGLRFVAVFMVLVEHFAYFIGNKIHAGFFGVDFFFCNQRIPYYRRLA